MEGTGVASVTEIRPIRPDQATEYSKGDVIADGGGCWWQRDESRPGQVAWARFGEIRLHRLDDIPEPHTLIARHGETTDLVRARQTAMALEGENMELRQALQQVRDIAAALARLDPLRDDS